MRLHERFNHSALSKFLNSPPGRIVRLAAGTAFLVVGLRFRHDLLGQAALVWSVFPITAGAFDVCYISAALGGPFHGAQIRGAFGKR